MMIMIMKVINIVNYNNNKMCTSDNDDDNECNKYCKL